MFWYKNLKSINLRPLLLLVNSIHSVSFSILVLSPIWVFAGMVIGYSLPYLLSFVIYGFMGVVLAGLLASLVAFEDSYRQRTEQLRGL